MRYQAGAQSLWGIAPAPAHRVPPPFPPEIGRAIYAEVLDGRRPLDYLFATLALEQGDLQRLARASGSGERDLRGRLAAGTQ